MNREVTLKTPFERDLDQISELSWVDLKLFEVNEKSNLSIKRTTTAKYHFMYIQFFHVKSFTLEI